MTPKRFRRFFRHGFLPQLMALEACARLGSVTRAAEELSLAQPTVSCMLRKLSDTLGGPVTRMVDRRVEATSLGAQAIALCADMFAAMERFEDSGLPDGAGYDPQPWRPSPSRPASP